MQAFTDLLVWQKAFAFVADVYAVTQSFPSEERYGLVSQVRRASVSICTNIAEGSRRRTDADFARFLNMAEGSAGEVECLLMLAESLAYVRREDAEPLRKVIAEIGRMLNSLRSKVSSDAKG